MPKKAHGLGRGLDALIPMREEVEKAINDLNDNESKRKEIGDRAMKYIEEEFAPEVIAKQIMDFISD